MTDADEMLVIRLRVLANMMNEINPAAAEPPTSAADRLEAIANKLQRMEEALTEIRGLVAKRQLPITNQVYDVADAALKD